MSRITHRSSFSLALLLNVLIFALAVQPSLAVSLEWTRQLGTSSPDLSFGVSADGLGSVYVSGITNGSLGGLNAGSSDAFVSKYDAAGNLQWTRQLGTRDADESYGISADGLGNVYISGYTNGSLGGPNAGNYDAFVSKFDAAGTLQWTKQLGSSAIEENYGVSADGLGNVYITGGTNGSLGGPNAGGSDAFVSKYDAGGNLLWTRQLGTSSPEYSQGVSADVLGNVYISGVAWGSLGGAYAGNGDVFVSKYDAAGNLQWTKQLGTSAYDANQGVSADGLGNVYISGFTNGSLDAPNAGGPDAFVGKYDAAGNLQWIRQLGTSAIDSNNAISADGLGNAYVSGVTFGSLGGPTAGAGDAFVSKYDAAGNLQWTKQLGTIADDFSYGVSADGLGNIFLSGYTSGSLGAPNAGPTDVFVAKYSDSVVPEPQSIVLVGLAILVLIGRFNPR
jgi:hypothetical protein